MKLHVISDIHLETRTSDDYANFIKTLESKQKLDQAHTLVIAGDLCCFRADRRGILEKALQKFSDMYTNVVYVPGNYEYWGSDIDTTKAQIQSYRDKYGTHILIDGQYVDIDGIVFGGGTLWYSKDAGNNFIDFNKIKKSHLDIWNQHENWLKMDLSKVDVCVTHHFPTNESVADVWKNYPNTAFFCARIESHLEKQTKLPKLWIHGHTHSPLDYSSLFGSRVYCNPMGYLNENANPNFWDRLLVEL